jgi:hypothetical protein
MNLLLISNYEEINSMTTRETCEELSFYTRPLNNKSYIYRFAHSVMADIICATYEKSEMNLRKTEDLEKRHETGQHYLLIDVLHANYARREYYEFHNVVIRDTWCGNGTVPGSTLVLVVQLTTVWYYVYISLRTTPPYYTT